MTDPRRLAIYARVSTDRQDPQPQLGRLRQWAESGGFEVALERFDVASGKLVRRPGADDIMAAARGHHVHAVAVVKVDRWARSMKHLASTVAELHDLHVGFYAVDQGLAVRRGDPTSNLILNILGACAEWEGSIISERTKDSLAARKAAGVRLGRPWWKVKGIPAPLQGEGSESTPLGKPPFTSQEGSP